MEEDVRFSCTCMSLFKVKVNYYYSLLAKNVHRKRIAQLNVCPLNQCSSSKPLSRALFLFSFYCIVGRHAREERTNVFYNCRCAYFVLKSNKAWECMLLFSFTQLFHHFFFHSLSLLLLFKWTQFTYFWRHVQVFGNATYATFRFFTSSDCGSVESLSN